MRIPLEVESIREQLPLPGLRGRELTPALGRLIQELRSAMRTGEDGRSVDPWQRFFEKHATALRSTEHHSQPAFSSSWMLYRAGMHDLVFEHLAKQMEGPGVQRWSDLFFSLVPRLTPQREPARASTLQLLARLARTVPERVGASLVLAFVHGHHALAREFRHLPEAQALPADALRSLEALELLWLGSFGETMARTETHRDASNLFSWVYWMAAALSGSERDAHVRLETFIRSQPLPGLEPATRRAVVEAIVRQRDWDEYNRVKVDLPAHPVASLLARIADLNRPGDDIGVDIDSYRYVLRRLSQALHVDLGESEDGLWRAIEYFGGNRTDFCTLSREGDLMDVDIVAPRLHAEEVQRKILHESVPSVLSEFARLAASHPESIYFETYAAELHLWLGDFEEARRAFAAIESRVATRWGYIGLGASLAMVGEDDAALAMWRRSNERFGEERERVATFCYRGEVRLRRGEIGEAQDDLGRAVRGRPTRLRAWLLLGQALDRAGKQAEAMEAWRQGIRLGLPVALSAGESLGMADEALTAFLTADSPPPIDTRVLCERMLATLRGNASSVIFTWFADRREYVTRPFDSFTLASVLAGR